MKILIDTGAFIAYFVKQEKYHDDVVNRYKLFRQQNTTLITSDYILDELMTWFCAKQSKSMLEKLVLSIQRMQNSGEIEVLSVDQLVFKKAQEILLKFSEHKISFTDATSYVLYKDYSINEIFTLDDDFKRMRVTTSF